jgi:patatin-like phospholipase/acyl hydrolase
MSDAPFRLLALDGGGIRGLFAASCLAHLEQHTGKRLADYFDLIVGTSTGAIIALGLSAGMTAHEVLCFYQEQGPRIFNGGRGWVGQLFRPKYDNHRLTEALKNIFGDQAMNDLKVPVCVASYELVQGVPRVFKDDHHPELHWGGGLTVWKVAAASSAAPLVFPAFQVQTQDSHIDGGIWANNPVMIGVTEAVRYFDRQISDVLALSIGTGTQAFRLERRRSAALGWIGWGRDKRIVNAVFDAQSQSAHWAAKLLLPQEQYIRIDADLSTSIPLDDYHTALPLIERGAQAGRMHKTKVEQLFLTTPATRRSH